MNGTWDATDYKVGSVWQDTFVGTDASPPSGFPPWRYFQRKAASLGNTFQNLSINQAIAYDEINPTAYPFQTATAAQSWAIQVNIDVLVTIAWTLDAGMRAVVQGLIAAGNPHIKYVQQCFYFSEDGACSPSDCISFYLDRGVKVIPCFIVTDNPTKTAYYARANCYNPGAKSAYDRGIYRQCVAAGMYDAFAWGLIYPNPYTDVPGQRPRAVTALDVIFNGSV